MSGLKEINWMIGGPQGTGVDSSATLFARAMTVAGYWVFGKREYHSNIKGKHSYFQVRTNHDPVQSSLDPIDLLASFEKSTAEIHAHELMKNGALIYDSVSTKPETLEGMDASVQLFPLNFQGILNEIAEETGVNPMKLVIMKNTIAVAASLALYGVEIDAIETALKGLFTGGKAKLVASNMLAATKAYKAVKALDGFGEYQYKLAKPSNPPAKDSRLLMNGAIACGLGKLKAGCRFLTYYSITPAVDECIYLEDRPEYGIVVMQCEDELSAVNMMNGAATTGIRSSTATSGPGFSLMAEGVGWAGINEVPVVVFNYQRGGPSTGLPTRSEQAELLFAVNFGHGEFPKIVIAPGDMYECFEDSFYSFNYADRYQTPVIVMPDKTLANNTQSIDFFDESELIIDRGQIVESPVKGDPLENIDESLEIYPRFKITDSGISPRPLPGTAGGIHWLTGDEHTESGHITEDPKTRMAMHEKRFRKLDLVLEEIPQDRQYKLYGPKDADLTVVSWGSVKGSVLDAMPILKAEHGITINHLHIRLMNPFPADAIADILKKAKNVLCVEMNFTNQLSQLITMRTGFQIPHHGVKYTGRPVSQCEIIEMVQDVVKNKTKKVVLSYGH